MKEYARVSRLPQDKRDRALQKENRRRLKQPCRSCADGTGLCTPFEERADACSGKNPRWKSARRRSSA